MGWKGGIIIYKAELEPISPLKDQNITTISYFATDLSH
jgi:hypothetical protein